MPQSVLTIPAYRSATGIDTQLTFSLAVVSCGAGVTSSFITVPQPLPDWIDLTRQIDMRFHVFSGNSPAIPGHAIQHKLVVTKERDGQICTQLTYTMTWPPPAVWPAFTCKRLIFIDDTLYPNPPFPGGSFQVGDTLGMLLYRNGTGGADNYGYTSYLATMIELIAYRRCQKLCC